MTIRKSSFRGAAMLVAIVFTIATPHQSRAEVFNRVDGTASSPIDFRFSSPKFWSPRRVPAKGDIANINLFQNIPLTRDTESLAELRMSNRARISTNEQVLTVRDGIGFIDLSDSRLTVTPNINRSEPELPFPTGKPAVDATRLDMSGAQIKLENGFVRLDGDDGIGNGRLNMDRTSLISGHGTILINGANTVFDTQGRILASGGLLKVDSDFGSFQFSSESVLDAKDGVSELRLGGPVAAGREDVGAFDGTINVHGGNKISFSDPLVIGGSATVNLGNNRSDNGALGSGAGRFQAPVLVEQRGDVKMSNGILTTARYVQAPGANLLVEGDETSDIIAGSGIDLRGTTTLNGNLNLAGNTLVSNEAVIDGTGALTLASSSREYKAGSGAGRSFSVPVVNNGILSPGVPCFVAGCDTTSLDFTSLTLSDSSVLALRIDGRAVQDFDRITGDDVSISGVLDVTIDFDVQPEIGDRFHIMDTNSRTGEFSSLRVSSEDVEDRNRYAIIYEGNDVFLEAQRPIIGSNSPFDFSGDGQLNADDIDLLSDAVLAHVDILDERAHDLTFDVNLDGRVGDTDRDFWVENVKGTHFGDADLDGAVEFGDFLSLSRGFGQNGTWANGDFNGDSDVGFSDFLLLSQNFGKTSSTAAAAVPEPASAALVLFGVLGLLGLRRR